MKTNININKKASAKNELGGTLANTKRDGTLYKGGLVISIKINNVGWAKTNATTDDDKNEYLNRNILGIKPVKPLEMSDYKLQAIPKTPRYRCPIRSKHTNEQCGKRFETRRGLKRHFTVTHNRNWDDVWAEVLHLKKKTAKKKKKKETKQKKPQKEISEITKKLRRNLTETKLVTEIKPMKELQILKTKQEESGINKTCPECGHYLSYSPIIIQTRRADEPPTIIYKCKKCKHNWREY